MKYFLIGWISLGLIACSQKPDTDLTATTALPTTAKSSQKYTNTTIKALFTRGKNRTVGNFTKVHFDIETSITNIITSKAMNCTQDTNDRFITCEASTDLSTLKPGIYRLLVKSGSGLLGCDLFEIIPGMIPVIITIDNESTGFYLISLITQQTGMREDEIYRRVRHILGAKDSVDYDLEPTLYDLFIYFGGDSNAETGATKLINAIKANKTLNINHQHGVTETVKPLF